jgi:hypothetical protein
MTTTTNDTKTCITGDLDILRSALARMSSVRIVPGNGSNLEVRVGMANPAIEALYADALARSRDEVDYRVRQQALCNAQVNADLMGQREYSLSTNIYGWVVCCFMSSNINGGRAGCTSRGISLAGCFQFIADNTQRPGQTFSCNLSRLPPEVQALVREEVARRSIPTQADFIEMLVG